MDDSTCGDETNPETIELTKTGSPRQPVKSTAVVKYSAINTPVNFARLKFNTDLKLPPSNWLTSSGESYGLHHVLPHSTGFSSFRLAHMFPDCVGEVDVVSDAENIKKLLKIPYSQGPVSMMVHRVENTLLIDEFDIHKHLLRQAENDWEWLRKFFFEHILQSLGNKEKVLSYKNNSRYALQQRSLVSKFLHYSLAEPERKDERSIGKAMPMPLVTARGPALPEPRLEEGLPDSMSNHDFTRNVVWTFEDIQMLLGTDMPIFGGSTHPCISLRLRDVAKPISVLTGIDYWLDNLMSNVPEVVMCYHLDGIVQRYELIKTEDLPHLPDAKFSPKIIRDVAQNILSFLKSNATKAGHTYWLFKGRNDDVVKLYDLSSLCSDSLVDKEQNPFTVPVGMLLYRVARNMKHSTNDSTSQPGTIRMLLKNCLSLLPKEKYPQIVTSVHYMMSDLYVPADTDPSSPELLDEPITEESPGDEEEESSMSNSVAVTALCVATRHFQTDSKCHHPPPLVGSLEERCKMSLQHVAEGLECLKYFGMPADNKGGDKKDEEPKMAKPFQAIPMPYSKIFPDNKNSKESKVKDGKSRRRKKNEAKSGKKDSRIDLSDNDTEDTSLKALLCKPQGEAMPTWHQPEKMDNESWKRHLCNLLIKKAQLVYTTLAEQHYGANRFGLSLRYISCMLNCCGEIQGLASLMLDRAGDCCFRIFQDWKNIEAHRADFAQEIIVIEKPFNLLKDEGADYSVIPSAIESMEDILLSSLHCFEKAISFQTSDSLIRKMGSVHNELGSMYMNLAAGVINESTEIINKSKFQKYFSQSEKHLQLGLKAFEKVSDNINLALLYSNTGRLMRLKAHYHSNPEPSHLTDPQKHFYDKAQSNYLSALNILGSRKANPTVWDTITWELSTTLFSIAMITQDYPLLINKTQEEAEREVAELLMKALKYCDVDTPGPKQPLYQFRSAKIHHRLASLYHKAYRDQTGDENRRKNVLQLCQIHYSKASKMLLLIEHPSDFLRVQLERVGLSEFIFETTSSNNLKLKTLQGALDIIVECKPILQIMNEMGKPSKIEKEDLDDLEVAEKKEEQEMITLLEARLQFILRNLIKLCMQNSNQKLAGLSAEAKEVYSFLLKRGSSDLVSYLVQVLEKLSCMKKT